MRKKQNLNYFKTHYESLGCIVELCGDCGGIVKMDYPEDRHSFDGPSISSGMYCQCPRKQRRDHKESPKLRFDL
jgi:hypothetical protein